jgi:hypothetical protein
MNDFIDAFLRDLAERYMPRYEYKVALTAEEVTAHGLERIGDTYRIRHTPPLFGWKDYGQ